MATQRAVRRRRLSSWLGDSRRLAVDHCVAARTAIAVVSQLDSNQAGSMARAGALRRHDGRRVSLLLDDDRLHATKGRWFLTT